MRRQNDIRRSIHNLYFFVAVLVYGQNTLALTVPEAFVEMDENFLRLSLQAAELSASVSEPGTLFDFPDASVFIDEPDKAMLIKIDDICFAAFRGPLVVTPDNIESFVDPIASDVCYNGICCPTRKEYRDAYLGVSYLQEFESALSDCAKSCCRNTDCFLTADEKCDVVLTGFSLGGAAAQVAAVVLSDMSPTIITFGQPPTMQLPCLPLNTKQYFRFVNTINQRNVFDLANSRGVLRYDPVPYLEVVETNQIGNVFLLGEESTGIVYYTNFEEAPVVDPDDLGLVNFFRIHDISAYTSKLIALLGSEGFPLPLEGFDTGHPCTLDSECRPQDSCSQGTCMEGRAVLGDVGDSCISDADCLPMNTCEGLLNPECKPKGGEGASCNEDLDCLSGLCEFTFRGFACTAPDTPSPTWSPTLFPTLFPTLSPTESPILAAPPTPAPTNSSPGFFFNGANSVSSANKNFFSTRTALPLTIGCLFWVLF